MQQLTHRFPDVARMEVMAFSLRAGLDLDLVMRGLDVEPDDPTNPYARLYRAICDGKTDNLSALLTNLLNNTTIAAVFVPILISIAMADPAYSATQLVLPVTLATTFGYSLPSASGRMALVSATG